MTEINVKLWQNPPLEFHPQVWWAWNDKLEKKEISRQIKEFAEKGFSGFFMHSRTGLVTPYLSDEWMEMVAHAVSEARNNHIQANIYDEDRWPSGNAGGKVAAIHPDKMKMALVYDKEKGAVREIESPKIPWFNGTAPCDPLQKEVTESFIKITHEQYRKVVGEDFGRTVSLVFTDEPSFHIENFNLVNVPEKRIPWSKTILSDFQQRYGYDLKDHLRELFFEEGDYHRVRYQFYRLMTEQFRDHYFKPIYEWCDRNNLKLTGHLLMEESMDGQTQTSAGVMPHYEYLHIPAIDYLGVDMGWGAITVKQVSSVARQLGKERILSEIYGGSGWGAKFKEMKITGEFNYVLGVDWLCLHISYYSIRGCRKYDWPPSFSGHQPYWNNFKKFNDYFARLGYILTRGEAVCKALLLHPIGSAWSLFSPDNRNHVRSLDKELNEIVYRLLGNQIDFDFGDELIMEKYGKVADGQFCIGKSAYDTVIVPPSLTWNRFTVQLLEQFLDAGGKVVWIKPVPAMVDQKRGGLIEVALNHKNSSIKEKGDFVGLLNGCKAIDMEGKDKESIFVQHRKTETEEIIFLLNTDPERSKQMECCVSLPVIEEWDSFTGERKPLVTFRKGDKTILPLKFGPGMSKLLIIRKDQKRADTLKGQTIETKSMVKVPLNGKWQIERKAPNVLMLEYARYRFGNGLWSEEVPVYSCPAAHNLQDVVEKIAGKHAVPWEITAEFKFSNALKNWRNRDICLVVEDLGKYKSVTVNGKEVLGRPVTNWLNDPCLKKIKMGDLMVSGANRITLKTHYFSSRDDFSYQFYEKGIEFEKIYLLGDFAVEKRREKRRFKLVEEKEMVDITEDLSTRGYPFFVGTIKISKNIDLPFVPSERAVVRFPKFNANVIGFSVNGKKADYLLWPGEILLNDSLRKGKNHIEIEFTNTLGSLWGRLHYPLMYPDPANWSDTYRFPKSGIGKAPELITRK